MSIIIGIIIISWIQSFWPSVPVSLRYEPLNEMAVTRVKEHESIFDENIMNVPEYQRLEGIPLASYKNKLENIEQDEEANNVHGTVNFLTKEFKSNEHIIPYAIDEDEVVVTDEEYQELNGLMNAVYSQAKKNQQTIRKEKASQAWNYWFLVLFILFGAINFFYAREITEFGTRLWYRNLEPTDFNIFTGKVAAFIMTLILIFVFLVSIRGDFFE